MHDYYPLSSDSIQSDEYQSSAESDPGDFDDSFERDAYLSECLESMESLEEESNGGETVQVSIICTENCNWGREKAVLRERLDDDEHCEHMDHDERCSCRDPNNFCYQILRS